MRYYRFLVLSCISYLLWACSPTFNWRDIPPGSVIVVPRDAAPFNLVAFSERLFGLLSNLAISAAALASISRNN